MIKLYIEENVLICEKDGIKEAVTFEPKAKSLRNGYVLIKWELTQPETYHYSEIEINGETCVNEIDACKKLKTICSVFKKGGGTGEGVQMSQVLAAIATHNEAEEAHIKLINDTNPVFTPEKGRFYEFGELSSLTLQNIPDSLQPIFIRFSVGAALTTLTLPNDLKNVKVDLKPNKSYEFQIIKKGLTYVEFE